MPRTFMLRAGIAAVFCLMASAASAQAFRGGTEAVYRELQKFHDDAVAKNNADDAAGAVEDYLPRLRVLSTSSPTIKGREALEKSWSEQAKGPNKPILVSEIQELEVNGNEVGDWAYMICRFAFVTVDRTTGAAVSDFSDGRYLAVLEKTAAGWKVLLDIDNGASGAAPDLVEKLRLEVGKLGR